MQPTQEPRRRQGRIVALVAALLFVLLGALAVSGLTAGRATSTTSSLDAKVQPNGVSGRTVGSSNPAPYGEAQTVTLPNGVKIGRSVKNDVSPPLRDIPPAAPVARAEENENPLPFKLPDTKVKDTVVQTGFGAMAMPTPILTFDGIDSVGSACGCLPPDTNGDVGPNHYVQTVNSAFAIWDKSGTIVQTPRQINTIWSGFGGPCQIRNDGDPIVLYDQLADRWFISQFTSSAPYGMCIAVSTSGDPTGTYNRYFFQLSLVDFYDYEKYGVWPDGYYMSANVFEGAGGFHAGAVVYDRAAMLAGSPATYQEFNPGSFYGPMLPTDLDGPNLPPAGAPNFFLSTANTIDTMYLWRFHVDWATPANSSFTGPTQIGVAPFDPNMCGGARQCIPQQGTTIKVDAIADRDMFRLAYRNFGSHESLVVNRTVDATSTDRAGVRWYEVRNPSSSPFLYQQGTYSPDANHRWMGSAAMDRQGNLAVGFSISSASMFPSIAYAGRLVTDPLGQLAQGEAMMHAGTGSQTSSSGRWGDYSSMSVDPTDDCTFWYTQEYYATTGGANWKTRIGKFKFPGCGPTTPTPTSTGTPPTATRTATATQTPTVVPTSCANYAISASAGATIVPGTQDIGIHCDDCGLQINLPFPVKLYGQTFNTANVSSNAVVSFVGSNYAFGNACLPVPVYNYTIFGFWDDLITNTGGDGVYSATAGTSPNRTFYLEFRAKSLDVGQAPVNMEFVFHEGSNNFEVVYGTTVAGNGSSATTGVQRNMLYYTQYSCNQPTILPGTRLSYTIADCPVQPTSTPQVTATPTSCAIQFTDVDPNHTFYPFIRCLACRGIINGYTTGCPSGNPCFRPENNVTRGQVAKIVSNAAGFSDPIANQSFEDVPVGSTFHEFVGRLAMRGIVGGYACGGPGEPCNPPLNLPYFRPNANVTRGQLAKMDSEAAGYSDVPSGQQFEDVAQGSTFYTYTYRLAIRTIMSGYACGGTGEPCNPPLNLPYFRPGNPATRGQTAKIVANTFYPNCNTPQR